MQTDKLYWLIIKEPGLPSKLRHDHYWDQRQASSWDSLSSSKRKGHRETEVKAGTLTPSCPSQQ